MKYKLDEELKSLGMLSGSLVAHFYPLLNSGYSRLKCKSDDDVTVTCFITPGYKDEKLSTLVIEPKGCIEKLPCIMFYHGGGFLLKPSQAHYQVAKWYASKANCKVVFADYRLLPENKYPVAIEDCYATYIWALENADKLNIDPDRIIVTGDSAGGNVACAITMMLNDRNIPLPKGALLVYPVLDKRMQTESMKKFTDTPIWDSRCDKMFWDMYLNEKDRDSAKYASISEAESVNYFPSTYVEVAEFDCLHDEGIEFAKRLESEGISVEVHDIKGACHGFESVLKSTMVEEAIKRRIAWITSIFDYNISWVGGD
jgi:acetyl esterase/lipase